MPSVLSGFNVRAESQRDVEDIGAVVREAFREQPHSRQTEAPIIDALRRDGALSLSLVAEKAGRIVGHIAFSPVTVTGGASGWYALGPLGVVPDAQGAGVGAALVWQGLRHLRQQGAAGSVALGEPAYYGRFGFRSTPALQLKGAPAGCFLVRPFARIVPLGEVSYHPAFDLADPADWSFP